MDDGDERVICNPPPHKMERFPDRSNLENLVQNVPYNAGRPNFMR